MLQVGPINAPPGGGLAVSEPIAASESISASEPIASSPRVCDIESARTQTQKNESERAVRMGVWSEREDIHDMHAISRYARHTDSLSQSVCLSTWSFHEIYDMHADAKCMQSGDVPQQYTASPAFQPSDWRARAILMAGILLDACYVCKYVGHFPIYPAPESIYVIDQSLESDVLGLFFPFFWACQNGWSNFWGSLRAVFFSSIFFFESENCAPQVFGLDVYIYTFLCIHIEVY